MLLSGVTLDDFTRKRTTVMQLPHGEQRELQDEWDVSQTRLQGMNGEQWQGFTELWISTILHHMFENFRMIGKVSRSSSRRTIFNRALVDMTTEHYQQWMNNHHLSSQSQRYDLVDFPHPTNLANKYENFMN